MAEELSGMATSPDGRRIFAVSERRNDRLLEFSFDGTEFHEVGRWPVPSSTTEVESLAWLGDGLLLLGTETQRSAEEDTLLVAYISPDRSLRWSETSIDYIAIWGEGRRRGRGIEAACAAGGVALIGRETPVMNDGRLAIRLAFGSTALDGWSAITIQTQLADDRLGLSSLACRTDASGAIRVWAILRDCDGGRFVVRAVLPAEPVAESVVPAQSSESACHDDRNSEAIAVIGDELFVLTDEGTGAQGSWLYRSKGGTFEAP
ncbi:MAG: hypothetical protein ACI9OJ_001061 [Myxococcota bacterium]|jgi:hypothetical protein